MIDFKSEKNFCGIELGTGDVYMVVIGWEGTDELAVYMKQVQPGAIGDSEDVGRVGEEPVKEGDVLDYSECVMIKGTPEGIDQLIHTLTEYRDQLADSRGKGGAR